MLASATACLFTLVLAQGVGKSRLAPASRPIGRVAAARWRSSASMADHGNEHGDASICAALVAAGIDAERALTTIPGLAHLDPRDLRASLTFLEGHFGSSRLGAFVRDHPEALFWSAGAIERLLRNDLGMSDSELARTCCA
mmetsp:Transcript_14917/g.37806  ORF Transcript_14917/g.37806 Transcript_14917/m.37806 type:complete len:141 (-) Transcript_14917:194-616(-)